MVISVYPTPETFRYSSITQLAQISDDFVDLSKQASADLSITMFRSIKDNCTRLTPNIKLVDFSSKIESIESVRRYDEKASAEMKHALAKIAERALTFKLEVSHPKPFLTLTILSIDWIVNFRRLPRVYPRHHSTTKPRYSV